VLSYFNNADLIGFGYFKNKYIYYTFKDEFDEHSESNGASRSNALKLNNGLTMTKNHFTANPAN
jgi:hypothetical protein